MTQSQTFGFESPPLMMFSRALGARQNRQRPTAPKSRTTSRKVVRVYDSNGRIAWRGTAWEYFRRESARRALGLADEARSYHVCDRQWRIANEFAFHAEGCGASRFLQRGTCTCGLGERGGAR